MPFTRLRYHIILATKHRRPWITTDVEDFLYPVLARTTKHLGGRLIAIGGIEDHVHMASAYPPEISPSKFAECLKSESTGALKRHRRALWHFEWADGYTCFTVSSHDLTGLITYIKSQKKHHRDDDLWKLHEPKTS